MEDCTALLLLPTQYVFYIYLCLLRPSFYRAFSCIWLILPTPIITELPLSFTYCSLITFQLQTHSLANALFGTSYIQKHVNIYRHAHARPSIRSTKNRLSNHRSLWGTRSKIHGTMKNLRCSTVYGTVRPDFLGTGMIRRPVVISAVLHRGPSTVKRSKATAQHGTNEK